jgi:SAM-dependent methyltransferase
MKRQRGDRDRGTYEDPQIISSYGRDRGLQPPEQTILDELGAELGEMDMLDLGVGAGRTAWFFAPRAKSYLGLDYAPAMIERCKRDLPAYEFVVGDACRLDFAPDNSYDFVLFSYNGIDHLELPERERALVEMKRVLRPGGLMAFSSHNANFLPVVIDNYRFRLHASARETARSLKWATVFNLHNPTLRFRLPFRVGMVKDGLHSFRSSGICYIRPDLQVAVLSRLGMADIGCAKNDAPHYLGSDDPQVATFASPWVYYRCRKPRRPS